MKPIVAVLGLVLACACNEGPPPRIVGEAQISITGDVTREFNGPVAFCGVLQRKDGKITVKGGGAWSIEEAGQFLFLVTAEEAPNKAMVVLRVQKGDGVENYQSQDADVQISADLTVATLDLTLKESFPDRTVHIKGTMTCPLLP